MERKEYIMRELLGVILYPFSFFLISICFVIAGLISKENVNIFNTIALITLIAGVINLIITYHITKTIRTRRGMRR
jgi:hypothetical protein